MQYLGEVPASPRFLPPGLGEGSPASWACPGPDSNKGSGPWSGVLGQQRDGIGWGWALSTTRRWLRWEVLFALGPTTCLKALPGPVTHQRLLDKPGSLITGYSLILSSLANGLESSCQLGKKTEAPLAPQTTETRPSGVRHRHRHFLREVDDSDVQPGLKSLTRSNSHFKDMETEARERERTCRKAEAGPRTLVFHS